ncbi:MAG: hypothetical protein HY820_23410 [Acidobacteria bacterium]|nr:hypothetical protein [Acidobacteriota bacterium]
MRVTFDISPFEMFYFSHDGIPYSIRDSFILAEKPNLAANIHESVLRTNDGKNIWLTVVGDTEENSEHGGIIRGWYVAIDLTDEHAAELIKAFSLWSRHG